MKSDLLNEIITHIFYNLKFLDSDSKQSICNNYFLCPQNFDFEDSSIISRVYGAQAVVNGYKFKLLAHHFFNENEDGGTFCCVIQMQDCPIYGCIGSYQDNKNVNNKIEDGILVYQINGSESWLPTTTFLQATFLAGMEQLKEMSIQFQKLDDKELFEVLKKLMIFQQEVD